MANNVFLISDTHFGHQAICGFVNEDGSKVRPFDQAEEMDQVMIDNWNRVVQPHDKVYHIGDVAMRKQFLPIMHKLNGRKVLVRGNHDIFELKEYVKYFYDVRGYHVLDNILMSHIPIHAGSLGRFKGNVHGHLHGRPVMDENNTPDPRYLSVCVERINYTPIEFCEVQKYFL